MSGGGVVSAAVAPEAGVGVVSCGECGGDIPEGRRRSWPRAQTCSKRCTRVRDQKRRAEAEARWAGLGERACEGCGELIEAGRRRRWPNAVTCGGCAPAAAGPGEVPDHLWSPVWAGFGARVGRMGSAAMSQMHLGGEADRRRSRKQVAVGGRSERSLGRGQARLQAAGVIEIERPKARKEGGEWHQGAMVVQARPPDADHARRPVSSFAAAEAAAEGSGLTTASADAVAIAIAELYAVQRAAEVDATIADVARAAGCHPVTAGRVLARFAALGLIGWRDDAAGFTLLSDSPLCPELPRYPIRTEADKRASQRRRARHSRKARKTTPAGIVLCEVEGCENPTEYGPDGNLYPKCRHCQFGGQDTPDAAPASAQGCPDCGGPADATGVYHFEGCPQATAEPHSHHDGHSPSGSHQGRQDGHSAQDRAQGHQDGHSGPTEPHSAQDRAQGHPSAASGPTEPHSGQDRAQGHPSAASGPTEPHSGQDRAQGHPSGHSPSGSHQGRRSAASGPTEPRSGPDPPG